MVWGAIGPDFRTDLIRCSKGVTGAEYVRIIEESRMIPTLNAKFGEGMWIYVQRRRNIAYVSSHIRLFSRSKSGGDAGLAPEFPRPEPNRDGLGNYEKASPATALRSE